MKVHLMFANRDFDPKEAPVPQSQSLIQDLELRAVFDAMAGGDEFLLKIANTVVMSPLSAAEAILFRQAILADCLAEANCIRALYALAVEAIERERKIWGSRSSRYPESVLHRSVEVLSQFLTVLKPLRLIANSEGQRFRSVGFRAFFNMVREELNEDYLALVEEHLKRLSLRGTIALSADLERKSHETVYTLHPPPPSKSWREHLQGWVEFITRQEPESYVYQVPDRDESGMNALADIRRHGIRNVASALAQSVDHVLSFFVQLRAELGFYVGCLNLRERLAKKGDPLSIPDIGSHRTDWAASGLYDMALTLSTTAPAIGNDVDANEKMLVMITGANRGGKSTFLRSVGQAQLMMQAGLFVGAKQFRAATCDGLFTHFKREEDAHMRSGKFDEELDRMSRIIDRLTHTSMVLLNESFAATNPREAAEIATQIVRALLDAGVKVIYVTHLFDLAHRLFTAKDANGLFLRAERLEDGRRTFRMVAGEPLATSHGADLYRHIFEREVSGA